MHFLCFITKTSHLVDLFGQKILNMYTWKLFVRKKYKKVNIEKDFSKHQPGKSAHREVYLKKNGLKKGAHREVFTNFREKVHIERDMHIERPLTETCFKNILKISLNTVRCSIRDASITAVYPISYRR